MPTSSAATEYSLPVTLTAFVGRQAELVTTCDLVRRFRLVTLVGAGGCGKTRLALRTAAVVADELADYLWWVDLAGMVAGESVATLSARAVGLREEPDGDPVTALVAYLEHRKALILLDNCEHVLDACASLVRRLLLGSPTLRVLATSREPLAMDGEAVWRVPAMSFPGEAVRSEAGAVAEFDAVQLFTARAQAALPSFRLDGTSAPAVADICRRLEGIPLAIELAAAQVAALDPGWIARGLDDCFRVLGEVKRSGTPRHRTLRASMDWSYGLLDEPEQMLFRRLAVFVRSFSVEAAEAVCAAEDLGRGAVLGLLLRLVRKSLVGVEDRGEDRRYRLLDMVRQYAGERLAEAQEAIPTRDRHLAYYLDLLDRVGPELEARGDPRLLDLLEAELGDLRAALAWAIESGAGESALRLANGSAAFYTTRMYVREGQQLLRAALRASGAQASRGRARALWCSAFLAWLSSDERGAEELAKQARELAQEVDDPATACSCSGHVGQHRAESSAREGARAASGERCPGPQWERPVV